MLCHCWCQSIPNAVSLLIPEHPKCCVTADTRASQMLCHCWCQSIQMLCHCWYQSIPNAVSLLIPEHPNAVSLLIPEHPKCCVTADARASKCCVTADARASKCCVTADARASQMLRHCWCQSIPNAVSLLMPEECIRFVCLKLQNFMRCFSQESYL